MFLVQSVETAARVGLELTTARPPARGLVEVVVVVAAAAVAEKSSPSSRLLHRRGPIR
jgi:hypothetical protein